MELPFDIPAEVDLMTDVSAAAWINERITPQDRTAGVRVSEVIPTGFEAYARVFHPARRPGSKIRWRDIAREHGLVAHPEMQFEHLVGTLDLDHLSPFDPPLKGNLPVDEVEALVETLSEHTATPDVGWFCVWAGYGFYGGGFSLSWSDDEDSAVVRERERAEAKRAEAAAAQLRTIPVVRLRPSADGRGALREYFLFRGPLTAASRLEFGVWVQAPNLWWPDDRAWCVATEIDGYSTYVGGTVASIDAVLGDHRMEAVRTSVDARFDLWSDEINPPPSGMWARSGDS